MPTSLVLSAPSASAPACALAAGIGLRSKESWHVAHLNTVLARRPDRATAHGARPLRPALRRLRPRAGPHRGPVREGLHGEVQRLRRPRVQPRAIIIKEQRAELVKHHLWVLWTDYFKPEHPERYPELHELVWTATKAAGESKKTSDVAVADQLLAEIDEIAEIFRETKKA